MSTVTRKQGIVPVHCWNGDPFDPQTFSGTVRIEWDEEPGCDPMIADVIEAEGTYSSMDDGASFVVWKDGRSLDGWIYRAVVDRFFAGTYEEVSR